MQIFKLIKNIYYLHFGKRNLGGNVLNCHRNTITMKIINCLKIALLFYIVKYNFSIQYTIAKGMMAN